MSNQIVSENQVLSFAPSSDKPGSWLEIQFIDDKGKQRKNYVKDESIAAGINKPGIYNITREKNGKYYDIVGAQFLRPLASTQTASETANPTARARGAIDANVLYQNKCITAQVCVKAAAELMGKAIEAGAFKLNAGMDVVGMSEAVATVAKMLMDEARDFVAPAEGKSGLKPGTYQDEVGRIHEPVPEGA